MDRPIAILIAALGGEGGGVLTDWLVQAISRAGLPVQSTSIPGVAQRTGATTYYVEAFPRTYADLDGQTPVFGLYPIPGAVDLVVASELLETGRAIENGFVSPERTTLIAATHRVYAVIEKAAMAEGRFDSDRVLRAAKEIPARAVLFDLTADPDHRALPINAVLLGAIAASGVLPLADELFRDAIRASGIAVDANLQGFEHGRALVLSPRADIAEPAGGEAAETPPPRDLSELVSMAARSFPADCLRTAELGLSRCADYQDLAYAKLYLDRLQPVLSLEANRAAGEPHPLTDEVARQLALWMTYEDIVRVADLKTQPERFDKVRREVRAKPDEPVRVRDFFKPGLEEVSAVLPRRLGARLAAFAERRDAKAWHLPLRLQSSGIIGFTLMWSLARLRRLRRLGHRFAEEQAEIGQWLDLVAAAAPRSHAFALELAALPGLRKGYGDTHSCGVSNYRLILAQLVVPAVEDATHDLDDMSERLQRARNAALADPEGMELKRVLGSDGRREFGMAAE